MWHGEGVMKEIAVVVVGLLGGAACTHQMPPDEHTGRDGTRRGAAPMVVHVKPGDSEYARARARDIVTYPGGDRIDWKRFDVTWAPSSLHVDLRWTSPRPGLQLRLDVFDSWGKPIAGAPRGRKRDARDLDLTIPVDHPGPVFVRVAAAQRGDAGAYVLAVDQTPAPPAD
jgi:hypothetical protein